MVNQVVVLMLRGENFPQFWDMFWGEKTLRSLYEILFERVVESE
jgi:hypothetical protein